MAALVCALAATGCTSLQGSEGKGYVSADGQVTEVAPEDRGDPVDFSGETVEGDPAALADLRGKPAVVPVWGPWCAPCVEEAPELADIAREYDGEASFLGIAIKNNSERASSATFQDDHDVPYPSVYSSDGSELLAFSGGLTPRSVPSLVFLDAQGRVAALILGPYPSAGTVRTLVDDLVAEDDADG